MRVLFSQSIARAYGECAQLVREGNIYKIGNLGNEAKGLWP